MRVDILLQIVVTAQAGDFFHEAFQRRRRHVHKFDCGLAVRVWRFLSG